MRALNESALRAWLPRLALPLALTSGVLLGYYVVANQDALHLDVNLTPALVAGVIAGLLLSLVILRHEAFALALLVAAVYLNLSHVLVRQGFPSLLQLVAVPLVLAALHARGAVEWGRLLRRPLTWAVVAYGLVLLGSTVYAASPDLADARVAETAKAMLIYLLVILLATSGRRVLLAAWTMVLAGAALAGLGALRVAGVRIPGVSDGLARFELAHIHGSLFEPRITGPLGDANFFAQILLVLVPVGLCLAWQARTRRARLLAWASVGALMIATVLTYSRGGALALGFVLILALLAHGISWKRLAVGGGVLLAAWAFAVPAEFTARLSTITQFLPGGSNTGRRDSSFEERLLLTGTAWEMFADNPGLGVGAGNYTARFSEYAERFGSAAPDYHDPAAPRYPHNLYLEVAAETGVPGIIAFGAVLIAAFGSLGRVRGAPPSGVHDLRGLARAFQIALAGYLVSSLFLHGDFERYLWLLLGMAGAMDLLVAAPRRAVPRQSGVDEPSSPLGESPSGGGAPEPGAMTARRGVAVLLSRFPSVTETFVLREVIEMERQGQPVLLIPLLRESPPVVHAEARPWVERALYTPFLSPAIVAANVRAFAHHPIRYIGVVARVILGTLHSPRVALGTIAIIPKSVYLAQQIASRGIRHVHAHFATHPTTAALIISTLTGASFSFTIHAHDLFSRRYRPLLPLKLRRAAFVRVISRYNLDHLRRLYPDVPLERVHVVHVGIETELYAGAADGSARETGGEIGAAQRPAPVRLLSVAALRDYKGLPVLLEACARLRRDGVELECDVVGEGPMRAELEQLIGELTLESCVRLAGAKPQDEVRRLLAERPIFVLPSIILHDGWMEGIPVALMEAMASGCAVVASRLSGIPELVESGVSGILVEPDNPQALADAIRLLANDEAQIRRLGSNGRAKVDAQFRLDRTVSELLELVDLHNEPVSLPTVPGFPRSLRPGTPAPLGVGWVHDGPDATAVELLVAARAPLAPPAHAPAERLILKIHRDHPKASRTAAERAHSEWAALRMFQHDWTPWPTGNGTVAPRPGVPEPFLCDIDQGWLVMDACAGRNLALTVRASRLDRGREDWSATLTALGHAGRWLDAFQRHAAGLRDVTAAVTAWDAAVTHDLERCGGVVPERLLRRTRARLGELAATVVPRIDRGVLQHGDFGPGNVFVGHDRVQVIDFEGVRPGLPDEDVAYFVAQLELFLSWPLLGTRRREAVSAFLNAYRHGSAADEPAYRMARLSKLLQILGRTDPAWQRSVKSRRRRRILLGMLADAIA